MADFYEVRDAHTGKVVKTFDNSRRAYAYADRADAKYGAVRYTVHPVWNDNVAA